MSDFRIWGPAMVIAISTGTVAGAGVIEDFEDALYHPSMAFYGSVGFTGGIATLDNAFGPGEGSTATLLGLGSNPFNEDRAASLVFTVDVTAGQSIEFDFMFDPDVDDFNSSVDNDRAYFVAEGQVYELANTIIGPSGSWQSYAYEFAATGEQEFAFVVVESRDDLVDPSPGRADGGAFGATLSVDNVALVPEPTTLGVMAAGLGLMLRRRKPSPTN